MSIQASDRRFARKLLNHYLIEKKVGEHDKLKNELESLIYERCGGFNLTGRVDVRGLDYPNRIYVLTCHILSTPTLPVDGDKDQLEYQKQQWREYALSEPWDGNGLPCDHPVASAFSTMVDSDAALASEQRGENAEESAMTCIKCGRRTVEANFMTTRSVDEAPTMIARCKYCRFEWRENN